MLHDPRYWQFHYRADDDDGKLQLLRAYSYSDRCRYYWPEPAVGGEIERLLFNLDQ